MKFIFELYRTKQKRELINSNDRLHFQQKAKMTKALRDKAKMVVENKLDTTTLPLYDKDKPCKVKVTIYSPTRRRLDPPNLYPTVKALIDGMTDAQLWTDDNYEVIKSMSFEYGGLSGSKAYKIELETEKLT
ncbi:MAG: hypothetical protein LBV67_07115 [Streptococcaceae bacterium]|jgi:crossover junction endodeoxyribonuclease RusA|nr:hypothetical protein [Streptococcaceae bacterium]